MQKLVERIPLKTIGTTSFMWIPFESMYMLAVTKKNVNAALVFEFLHKLEKVFLAYFGGKKQSINEDIIKENIPLILELIDEVLDFGYPQNCEPDILKTYITTKDLPVDAVQQMNKITTGITGVVSWRQEGIIHRKNEIFIDIIENVNMLMSNKGQILSSGVTGKIEMNCFLSGMPDCKFGLNDKLMMRKNPSSNGNSELQKRTQKSIDIDDINFHQCVQLSKFDSDRTISFIPPDGKFDLMTYRISNLIVPPFRIISPIVREIGKSNIEANVEVKSVFDRRLFGKKVIVKVPLPTNVAKCKIRVTIGRAKYKPEKGGIIWSIKRFPGSERHNLNAEVELTQLTDARKKWDRPPIALAFEVPMYTASGLHVRFLRVVEKKMDYKATKWVRYVSRATLPDEQKHKGEGGGFEIRI